MSLTRHEALNWLRLPGRLDVPETSILLGVAEHDIPILVRARLLTPMGSPAANSPKYFSRDEIIQKSGDHEWLSKSTKAVSLYWRKKRSKEGIHPAEAPKSTSRATVGHDG
jgi:hypothetical protein